MARFEDTIGVAGISDMPSPSRERGAPIAVAVDQHESELSMLNEEIRILIDRIRMVTGPEQPENNNTSSTPAAPTSSLASQINGWSYALREMRLLVKDVRERIEL